MADFDVRKSFLHGEGCLAGCFWRCWWIGVIVVAVLWLLGSTGLQWARLLWR